MSMEDEFEELEQCRAYITSQLEEEQKAAGGRILPSGPAVTISLQYGAGGHEVARRLAELLQKTVPTSVKQWTVFDRNLVEKVIEEHHLPKRLAEQLSEERRSYIEEVMEELVGLRPPSWLLVPKIAETIVHLADAGHVILVGWGANVITARLPNVFHTRLIASQSKRIAYVQQTRNLTAEEAARLVEKEDRSRDAYVKTYFHSRASDDLRYHLIINTELVTLEDTARLIAEAAQRSFRDFGQQPEAMPGRRAATMQS